MEFGVFEIFTYDGLINSSICLVPFSLLKYSHFHQKPLDSVLFLDQLFSIIHCTKLISLARKKVTGFNLNPKKFLARCSH
ncbi:hypothetical protein L1887_36450 [Cichorium endivia]|nr:hypothetical protein L1887_36450 [Cichorium endivia]